jgi:hypothetical protein
MKLLRRVCRSAVEWLIGIALMIGWLLLGFVVCPLAMALFWIGPSVAYSVLSGAGVEEGLARVELLTSNVFTNLLLFLANVAVWGSLYLVLIGPLWIYAWCRYEGATRLEVWREFRALRLE